MPQPPLVRHTGKKKLSVADRQSGPTEDPRSKHILIRHLFLAYHKRTGVSNESRSKEKE